MAKISERLLEQSIAAARRDVEKDNVATSFKPRVAVAMLTELQTLRELAIEAKRHNNWRPAYADDVLAEKIRVWEQL